MLYNQWTSPFIDIRLSSAMTSFSGIWLVLTVIAVKTNCVQPSLVICSNIAYWQVISVYSVFFIVNVGYSGGGSIIAWGAAPSWEVRTRSTGWWTISRQCSWGRLVVIIYFVGLHCLLWNLNNRSNVVSREIFPVGVLKIWKAHYSPVLFVFSCQVAFS